MKKARSIFVAVFLVAVGAAALALFLQREPSYEGKPLRYWLETMQGGSGPDRDQARTAIRGMGKAAIPHLIRILRDEESQIGQSIQYLTNEWKYSARFFRPERPVQTAAVTLLGELGTAATLAIPALETATRSDNVMLACRAEAALRKIRGLPLAPLLLALTNTCDITNWNRNVGIVAELGESAREAIPMLVAALHDTNLQVRIMAVDALNRIHDERAIDSLIESLRDEESSVRKLCLYSLANFRSDAASARPAIIPLLHDSDPYMRSAAMSALCRVTPPAEMDSVREPLSHLLTDPSEYIRRDVTQRLHRASNPVRGTNAIPSLPRR